MIDHDILQFFKTDKILELTVVYKSLYTKVSSARWCGKLWSTVAGRWGPALLSCDKWWLGKV